MITMDIFNNSAFSTIEMLRGLERKPYRPGMLGDLIGFDAVPASRTTVAIQRRTKGFGIIKSTLRGAPIEMRGPGARDVRPFIIPRVAEGDQIWAEQLQGLVPFEGDGEVETVAAEIARIQEGLIDDVEVTFENMRLGAVRGIVLDKDGSTMFNYWTEWGVSQPAAIDLDLDNAAPTAYKLHRDINSLVVRPLARAAQMGNAPGQRLLALCGDEFFDRLTTHPDVVRTYEGWAAAADLRSRPVWEPFRYANIDWVNYRGTDDGSTIAITGTQAIAFPTGVRGMFQHVMGPGESFDTVNRPGRRFFPLIVRDKDRDQWVQPEIYSYPLFLNTRPDLVLTLQV